MNIVRMYKSRKYLLRILLSITLVMVVLLIISSAAQYYTSEKTILTIQQEANRKVFEQIHYNLDGINELVKNLAISTFLDYDTIFLMNSNSVDFTELYPRIMRLEKTVNATPFLHSIMIYNVHNECFYSTQLVLSCQDDGMKGVMAEYLRSHDDIPRMKFIPISMVPLQGSRIPVHVFSFFMYESSVHTNKSSVLIINVKPEWVFSQLKNMDERKGQLDRNTFIMTETGAFLNSDADRVNQLDEYGKIIIRHLESTNQDVDYLLTGKGKDKKLISYMHSQKNDWLIVSIQPYDVLLVNINKMRTVSIILILCFVLLSTIVAVAVSFRIYMPIQRMMKQIGKDSGPGSDSLAQGKDELSVISGEYTQAMENIKSLTMDKIETRDIVKRYHLKKLLLDSVTLSRQEIQNLLQGGNLKVKLDRMMILCLLRINNFGDESFVRETSSGDRRLYRFAVSNIAVEIISRKFANEMIDMGEGHLIVLMNPIEEAMDNFITEIQKLLKDIQQYTQKYYRLSLSAAVGNPLEQLSDITRGYEEVLEYLKYRLVYGKTAVILPSMIRDNIDHREYYVLIERNKKLNESIRSGQFEQAEELLAQLFDYMANFSYESIQHTILSLIMALQNTVKEINRNNIRQISIDLHDFYQSIMSKETLEEVRILFVHLLRELAIKKKEAANEGADPVLVETIKEMIEERYMDVNLSLQEIASALRLSSAHISKIFKRRESISIVEYITDVRLNHACCLLENTDVNVNDIALKIGFANQSYFFKLFKKKFGTTPKEFRIKRNID